MSTAVPSPYPTPAPSQFSSLIRMNWECSVAKKLRGESSRVCARLWCSWQIIKSSHDATTSLLFRILPLLADLPIWSQLLHLFMSDCLYWLSFGGMMAHGWVFIFTRVTQRVYVKTFWGCCYVSGIKIYVSILSVYRLLLALNRWSTICL